MPKKKDRTRSSLCTCECDEDSLVLKWGTLKGWHFHTEKQVELLRQYNVEGMSASAAMQRDTPRQKEIICALIDECNTPIYNDWEGKKMTKKAAKQYVMEY